MRKDQKNEENKEKMKKKWGNTGENEKKTVKIRKIGWKKMSKNGEIFVPQI